MSSRGESPREASPGANAGLRSGLFRRKSIARLTAEAEGDGKLNRVLGPWSLTFLGMGATIGTGIFVLAGTVARDQAGPAISVSFLIAAVGCAFAALAYAELAGMVPVSGSAYTYAYATLGEFIAWTLGWLMILEYSVSAAAVAQGWANYFADIVQSLANWSIDPRLRTAPWDFDYASGLFSLTKVATSAGSEQAVMNAPALAIVLAITVFLIAGIKGSARLNATILFINLAVIAMVLALGFFHAERANWTPFVHPQKGWPGVLSGASLIFFAYIGFDATATYAEEARSPRRDLPIGILASLAICTAIYIGMSFVLTGMVPFAHIDVKAPFAAAFRARGLVWPARLIGLGVLAATTNVVLVGIASQARIFLAMARDGLLPPRIFAAIHPRFRTPAASTLLIGVFVAIAAAFAPLNLLAEIVNIGTLLIYVIVCAAVLVLRKTDPHARRSFRTPWLTPIALAGMAVNLMLMKTLGWRQAVGLLIWLALGSAAYFAYGFRHSKLRSEPN